jgi:thiamine biosynthesis lipoprotein
MSVSALEPVAEPGFDRFSIWGTSALLGLTEPDALGAARRRLDEILADVEQAASRFRPGTEILALNAAAGRGAFEASAMLLDLVTTALWAAELTKGACDPTVADSLVALGYDRDFDAIVDDGAALADDAAHPAPGIAGIEIDAGRSTISLPAGVHLDLGSTAKARAADLAAEELARSFGCGALVDLGGDLRIAGDAPVEGWRIGIVDSARGHESDVVHEVVAVRAGGIASSSSAVRTWRRGERSLHHVIDPATGWPARGDFSLVTVAAASCVEANALSTAALVWGEEALFELPQRSVAARLARADGSVERVGGWPEPTGEAR